MRSSPGSIRNNCGQLPVEGHASIVEHDLLSAGSFQRRVLWAWSLEGATGAVGAGFSQYRPLLIPQIYTQQTLHLFRASGGLSPRRLPDRVSSEAVLDQRILRAVPCHDQPRRQARRRCRDRKWHIGRSTGRSDGCGHTRYRLPRRLRRRIGPMDATSQERVARRAIRLPLGRIEPMVA
jgi:hypothetical protein